MRHSNRVLFKFDKSISVGARSGILSNIKLDWLKQEPDCFYFEPNLVNIEQNLVGYLTRVRFTPLLTGLFSLEKTRLKHHAVGRLCILILGG